MDYDAEESKCLMPVRTKEDLSKFRSLFLNQFKKILSENHIWYSVFYRPTKSHFTRVQRVSCAYSFVLLTMICNAMYYYPQDDFVRPTDIIMGPIVIRLADLYVSLVCVLITTVITLFIIAMFKYSRPKKSDIYDTGEEIDQSKLNKMEFLKKTSFLLEKTLVEKAKDNKRKCGLPHCCVYLGWVLVFLSFAASSFFLMLFSMEWGKHKSEQWLTSFLLSFFESAMVLDPMKVCAIF